MLTFQLGSQRIFTIRPVEDSLGANILDGKTQKPASVRIPLIKPRIIKERIEGFDVRFREFLEQGKSGAFYWWFFEPFLPFKRLVSMGY